MDEDLLDIREREIVDIIVRLQEEHRKQLKPYVDQLIRIRSLRTPKLTFPFPTKPG